MDNLYSQNYRAIRDEDVDYRPRRFDGFKCAAKAADGLPITVEMVDKQDHVPGYLKNGARFEALTTWIRVTFSKPRGPDGETVMENYLQVDRWKFGRHGDDKARRFRLEQDRAALISMGVDVSSLPAELFAALQ